jgi:hypothetical protein
MTGATSRDQRERFREPPTETKGNLHKSCTQLLELIESAREPDCVYNSGSQYSASCKKRRVPLWGKAKFADIDNYGAYRLGG